MKPKKITFRKPKNSSNRSGYNLFCDELQHNLLSMKDAILGADTSSIGAALW
jgi:hypothetical protein